MLRPKALLPWRTSTFLQEIAKTFQRAGLSPIIVVIRDDDTGRQISALVKDLAEVVVNPDPDRGMSSSLQLGAQALLAHNVTRALITPVDQPQVSVALCEQLCDALRQGRWAVAAHGSQWGHPYACPELSALAALDPTKSAQHLLQKNDPLLLEGGPQVLFNLNTPEEYQAAYLSGCVDDERPTGAPGTAQTSKKRSPRHE